jgi:integrase/recombinase XerD
MGADLGQLVDDYLAVRRALGFQLKAEGSILVRYLAFLDGRGEAAVTVDNALAFAQADPALTARGKALRMSAIRCFARWATAVDPAVQVPPARLLPARPTRPAPFIYTPGQVDDLLTAADRLAPAMLAASMRTLIGLMAATGIRTGEALGLQSTDWDRAAGVLTVTGKYAKTRALPVHPSVASALGGYLEQRRTLGMLKTSPTLLVSSTGRQLRSGTVHPVFRDLTRRTGIATASPACRPRLHDLRHTFAVSTMLDAYRVPQGDPAATLVVLSTWLGHADPKDTYWYLTGTAELMAAAAARAQNRADQHTPGRRP